MPGSTNYPTSLDSHTGGNPFGFAETPNFRSTTLNGSHTNVVTTLTVVSTTGFPTRGMVSVETEVITYTGVTATTFTGCTRGAGGSTAAAHASGLTVAVVPTAAHHDDLAAAIVATETKIGTGSSTPTANTVLRGTGTGASAFGQIVNGDITNSTIAISKTEMGVSRQNYLMNPNFQWWQRGTSVAVTATAYTADRWQWVRGGTSSATISRAASGSTFPNSQYCMSFAYTHNAASQVQQKIEDYYPFRGRTVTFAATILCSTASAIRVWVHDGVALTYSSYHSGSGGQERLSVSVAVSAVATQMIVGFDLGASATTFATDCTLMIGSVSSGLSLNTDYAGIKPADDFAACQRHYEVLGDPAVAAGPPGINASANGAHVIGDWIPFVVRKSGTPTITKNGTWSLVNCAGQTIDSPSSNGFRMYVTASGAGAVSLNRDSVDDTVTAEHNP